MNVNEFRHIHRKFAAESFAACFVRITLPTLLLSVLAIDRRSVEKIAAEIKCTLWKIVKIFNELMVKKGDFACIAD